ncbi:MAG: hypothetical protein DRO05_00570 [Thermoproteota archaeon]|nr:MAG: hypothetical protein DRO05_00570 [Candidatus Korarchaeota archaeon]
MCQIFRTKWGKENAVFSIFLLSPGSSLSRFSSLFSRFSLFPSLLLSPLGYLPFIPFSPPVFFSPPQAKPRSQRPFFPSLLRVP